MFYAVRFSNNQIHMIVNDTTWGDSSDREGTKMRLIKTSLISPENYTTIEIKEGNTSPNVLKRIINPSTKYSFTVRPVSNNPGE